MCVKYNDADTLYYWRGAASSNCRRRQPGTRARCHIAKASSSPSFSSRVYRFVAKRRLIDVLSAQSADGPCRILPIVSCCVVFLVCAIPACQRNSTGSGHAV